MKNLRHKIKLKRAKRAWINNMKILYPNFKKRLWAKSSYRIAHPQKF